MTRTGLVLAAAALSVLPIVGTISAHAATPAPKPRTVTATYLGSSYLNTPAGNKSLPSFTTNGPLGDVNLGSAELKLIPSDRFAVVHLRDTSGLPVGAYLHYLDVYNNDIGTTTLFCGTSPRVAVPLYAQYLEVVPTLVGTCSAPALEGTVTAVLSPATPKKSKR